MWTVTAKADSLAAASGLMTLTNSAETAGKVSTHIMTRDVMVM